MNAHVLRSHYKLKIQNDISKNCEMELKWHQFMSKGFYSMNATISKSTLKLEIRWHHS